MGIGIGISVRVGVLFDEAVERTRAVLKDQGFGVLSEVDVQQTLREKLGEETERYLILSACNPALAHRALGVDRRIGLLLPGSSGAGGRRRSIRRLWSVRPANPGSSRSPRSRRPAAQGRGHHRFLIYSRPWPHCPGCSPNGG